MDARLMNTDLQLLRETQYIYVSVTASPLVRLSFERKYGQNRADTLYKICCVGGSSSGNWVVPKRSKKCNMQS